MDGASFYERVDRWVYGPAQSYPVGGRQRNTKDEGRKEGRKEGS